MVLTMFNGSYLADALDVPLFYGFIEVFIIFTYCIWAWKMGWTNAPENEPLHKIIFKSYEPESGKRAGIEIGDISSNELAGSPYNAMHERQSASVIL